jgi:diaminopropionate ammonia-lyase
MQETIKLVHHEKKDALINASPFTVKHAQTARSFHSTFPGYAPTPLAELDTLAETLGIAGMYVKDESYRFGLNAFKGLGGSYSLGCYIAKKLGKEMSEPTVAAAPGKEMSEPVSSDSAGGKTQAISFSDITSEETRRKLGEITFVTATDGNHGRGVAWTAHMLGQKAVVYMPKGSVQERLENIRRLGAEAEITDMNYDDTVAFAARQAEEKGWILIQDTAWEGYEEIPTWIMQGYMTLGLEAVEQLGGRKPTHIFLQAGVGAMSGALAAFFTDYYGADKPVITIVEPNKADCIYQTALADDGRVHTVTGDLATIMAGLACGVPCTIGWNELNRCAENFASVPDWVAAKGMRILGNPAGTDRRVISGESGAVTTGFVCEVMQNESLAELRQTIGLDRNSVVLCISTEGDTDRENYRRIVWDGKYPSC